MEEEMEGEEVGEPGTASGDCCAAPFLFCFSSSSCMSASGEDEDTAAYEAEFGCTQVASTISESKTERGEEAGQGGETGETGGVMDEVEGGESEVEGEVREARWDAQVFFSVLAVLSWEATEGDNAAFETEFCCTQGVFFTSLAIDTVELEERREGRGVMGVRMRMVR
jgi:hypothetical protein